NSNAAHSPASRSAEDGTLTGPTPRLCLMMARLEEAEKGSGAGAREWLDRAVTAMPDPRHGCTGCGGESLEWRAPPPYLCRALCPNGGSLDVVVGRTPARATAAGTLPVVVADPHKAESWEMPAEHPAS